MNTTLDRRVAIAEAWHEVYAQALDVLGDESLAVKAADGFQAEALRCSELAGVMIAVNTSADNLKRLVATRGASR